MGMSYGWLRGERCAFHIDGQCRNAWVPSATCGRDYWCSQFALLLTCSECGKMQTVFCPEWGGSEFIIDGEPAEWVCSVCSDDEVQVPEPEEEKPKPRGRKPRKPRRVKKESEPTTPEPPASDAE